ncbi:LPS-assembly protein LptD [bacterium]|nr:LPS-assembly protein LptD [bacterium]
MLQRLTLLLFLVQCSFLLFGQIDGFKPGSDSTSQRPFQASDSSRNDSITVNYQSKSGLESKVSYAGDSIFLKMKERKAYLYGNAWITYEDIKLEADYIVVDFDKKEVYSKGIISDSSGSYVGRPNFTDKGKVYEADTMKYNFQTKKGLSWGVLTTEKDGYIHGDKILRDSNENIYVKDARFTTCNLPDPHFYIAADKIKIIPQKQIVTGPANLVVADIPTPLFVPFGFFPIPEEKSKGLIFPSFGEDPTYGYRIRGLGYFMPINDYFDIQVTTDLYFRGRYSIAARSNYHKRYKYRGNVGFQYTVSPIGERASPTFNKTKDLKIDWTFNQDNRARPNSNFSASVNFATSQYYKNNVINYEDIIRSNNNSSINYGRSFFRGKLNLSANSTIYQDLSKEQVDVTLPQLTVNVSRQLPFSNYLAPNFKSFQGFMRNLGVAYQGNFRNEASVKEQTFLSTQVFDSLRNGISHSVPISTSFKALTWITVSPGFTFNEYWYFKTTRKEWDESSDSLIVNENIAGFERAHQFSADMSMSTILYGMFKNPFNGPVRVVRHVMQPNIGVSWNPDFTKGVASGYRDVQVDTAGTIRQYSIFENGNVGRPSLGARAAINFGMGNNLEMKVRSENDSTGTGLKKIKLIENLRLSGSYNFLADSIKLSNLNVNGNTTILNRVRINFRTVLDPYFYDSVGTRVFKVDEYLWEKQQKIAWFSLFNIQFSFALNPNAFKKKESSKVDQTELDFINNNPQYYIDFSIPWNISLNYNYNINRGFYGDNNVTNTIRLGGDINLTENWKMVANTSYDIEERKINLTSFEFYRDLHCWQFNFKWFPIGRQQFEFGISAKSSTLQDLKLNRVRNWWN